MKTKTLKRISIVFLAVLVMLSSMSLTALTTVRAEEDSVPAVTEEMVEENVEEVTEAATEPVYIEETQAVVDVPAEAETAPPAVEAASEETTAEEAVVTDIEATSEETVVEETKATEEETEVKMPAAEFNGSANGVNVRVVADEGTFPEGTKMIVTAVSTAQVYDTVNAVTEGEAKDVKAVDITFIGPDGKEIQPAKNVHMTMNVPGMAQDADIVHIADNGAADVIESANIVGDKAYVEAESFSIYAVVETGEDARLKVNFVGLNNEEIASIYVKKGDNMEQVLYDPGAGQLGEGVYFRGWTTDPNYTTSTTAKTIAEVRTEVAATLPPATDSTEVTYYAMLFKDYRITYLDEHDISLGQEEVSFRANSTSAEQSYTVNMAYTVQDETHHFEGWNVVEGGDYISGYTEGKKYENKDVITITGDVTFGVNAPEGHWFIFDENGKGATYNAPQFVYSLDKPSRPDDSRMIRNGYTFGGWFADKATADQTSGGTQYDFDQTLTDKTTVYARWIPKTSAGYTIIIWRQNLAGDGYDFEEAVSLTGAVDSTINTVTRQGTGDNAYARVNGVNKQYTGFHLKEFDQNVTIKTEGNSVLNVYYDRNEYTLQFQDIVYTYTPTTSNNGTQYGLVDGAYVELTRHNSGSGFNPNYYWTYGNNIRYNGTRYTRSNGSWQTIKEIKALYEQNIGDNFPIVGTNGRTYDQGERWMPQSSRLFDNVIVFLDTMPNESVTFRVDENAHPTRTMRYYVEALPGQTPDITFRGRGFTLYNTLYANLGYIDRDLDWLDLNGYSKFDSDPSNWNAQGRLNVNSINFFYTRNLYTINFMDGKYVTGDGNPIEDQPDMGQIGTEEGIAYGADVSSHNDFEPETTPSGFVFEGWYIDEACTQPFTFTTMPEGGITVYAKWRQKQYRVFLHPNYPEGATGNIDWGTTRQDMTFRVSEGGTVSEPTGRLTGFEFVGWYLDPACSQVFNGEAYIINETNVTTPYDKTVDMTDTYDNNGNLINPKFNSDATGYEGGDRFWITKKLDIYAKWRSTLDGASGIVVEYDANGGTGAPTDTHTYVDGALAPAGAASKSSDSKKVFGYWEVQKWENGAWTGTGTKVVPGKTFQVLAKNAKVEEITPAPASGDTKKYTVQLKAVYIDSEAPTPTHIYWYKNDGSAAFQKNENLAINAGVNIPAAPTRDGYEFLGWARVDIKVNGSTENVTLEQALVWETTEANYTQNDATEYLFYDGSAYHLNSTTGTTVTQVAADEDHPYQAMFAVWSKLDELTYNANGGSGTMNPTYGKTGQEVTVAANAFTRDNYEFTGWNTQADGTGTSYAAEDPYTLTDGDDILYAQWESTEIPDELTYKANGGTGEMDPTAGIQGQAVTIAANEFSYAGHSFTGWNTKPDGTGTPYNAGATYTLTEEEDILYAQWTGAETTLTYDANGGSGSMPAQTGKVDETVTVQENAFSRDHYEFAGWNTKDDGSGDPYAVGESYKLTAEDNILYAQWTPLLELNLTSEPKTVTYTGAEQINDSYTATVTIGGETADVPAGYELVVYSKDESGEEIELVPAKGTDAGTYTATIFAKLVPSSKAALAFIYDDTAEATADLKLTINQAPLTITTPSATKEADGTALRAPITSQADAIKGLVNGETATVTATGSQTAAGSSRNTYSITWGTGKAANYKITENLGTLTVTAPAPDFIPDGPPVVPIIVPDDPTPQAPVIVPDDPTPQVEPTTPEEIDNNPTPKTNTKTWALLNLILSAITVILAIVMIITFATGSKDDDDDNDPGTKAAGAEGEEKKRQRNGLKFLGLIPAIGTVVLFFLTEDLTAKMAFTDKWTILTAVITVVGIVLTILIRNKKNKKDDEAENADA